MFIVILFVLPILFSCTKEIQINFHNSNQLLIVNSIFTDNKPFSFKFSYTAPILSSYDTITDSLHCILCQNKYPIIDTLLLSNNLNTKIIPKRNTNYTLEVHAKKYPVLSANDSIPQLVAIDSATVRANAGVDAYGTQYVEASITFTDPPNQKNYYELVIYDLDVYYYYYWFGSNELPVTDPVLLNEGDIDYNPTSYFFSDELFDGKQYTMKIKQQGTIQSGKPTNTFAILRSVSKSYYLYRKYYTRFVHNQQVDGNFINLVFMGEPQPMYTNIINGYGIFAGYTETTANLTYKP